MPVTAKQEPPRGEGGVPLPGAKRREKGEGAIATQGDVPNPGEGASATQGDAPSAQKKAR